MIGIQRQSETFAWRTGSSRITAATIREAQLVADSWGPRIASFFRKAETSEEMQAYLEQEKKKLLNGAGIDLDILRRMHSTWVLKEKPYSPELKAIHTPETALKHWLSGCAPFLMDMLPEATTQRLFWNQNPHNKEFDENLNDLYNDDGSFDKYTAGMVALHSEANGNVSLKNKILSRTLAADMKRMKQQGLERRPDGSFGTPKKYMGHGKYPTETPDSGPRFKYEVDLPDGSKGEKWHYPGYPDVTGPPEDYSPQQKLPGM